MTANHLLLWLSARCQGSWQQFRTAVEQLHVAGQITEDDSLEPENADDSSGLPLYQELRLNLERLAHVEFRARGCEDGWRVVPPTLAVSPQAHQWFGVLCGARSSKLLSRIRDASRAIELEIIPIPSCPDLIRGITDDYRNLTAVAQLAGLRFQMHAPLAILLSHPAVDGFAMRTRSELPFGADWSVHRFSCSDLSWVPATQHEASISPGALFRFTYLYKRKYFYCADGETFQTANRIGKYIALRRQRCSVFRYDGRTGELRLPAICRPPIVIERALILCSGMPPTYGPDTKTLHYFDIPQRVADLATKLLRQEKE